VKKTIRTFGTALRALRRNKTRAFLTMLGIMIGVGAVIAMMEIGQGSSTAIQKTVSSMGANNVMIFPGNVQAGGVSTGAGGSVTLRPEDADQIAIDCPAVKAVAPVVQSRTQIVYGGKNWVPQSIVGSTPEYLDVRGWTVQDGDVFSDRDVADRTMVCLVGQTIIKQLFNGDSPIGKEIRLNNQPFKVVGTLTSKGANMMGQDQDDVVLAPWTAIKFRVSGAALAKSNQSAAAASTGTVNTLSSLYPGGGTVLYPPAATNQNSPMMTRFISVDQIVAAARSAEETDAVLQQVTTLLRERHHLASGDPDDFSIRNMTEITNALSGTTQLMTKLLLSVALISLVVGGVGIMNIMLVSVTERTREIGLRMAVGARAADILRQFLTEAVVLSLTGGGIGILLGWGCSYLVRTIAHWPTESSPLAVFAAVIVSASVGVAFGYYPAWKASRLDPIDALRYE
jgi:ABC-type antimicrobial peptide transport system permease subunit